MESLTTVQPLTIEKSKISSKSYGIIKGYSANSHAGSMLNYNEDRICIVTNLTKTNSKQRQISFFGVYDGNGGIYKADFLRDNFHLFLVEDISFTDDMESAMRRSLQRITKMFIEEQRFQCDESSVSFAILVIASNTY
jgi:serine/threonine protein phosphatase PrpC